VIWLLSLVIISQERKSNSNNRPLGSVQCGVGVGGTGKDG